MTITRLALITALLLFGCHKPIGAPPTCDAAEARACMSHSYFNAHIECAEYDTNDDGFVGMDEIATCIEASK
jgi:hypothetical protein